MCPWCCSGTKWLAHGLDGRDPAVGGATVLRERAALYEGPAASSAGHRFRDEGGRGSFREGRQRLDRSSRRMQRGPRRRTSLQPSSARTLAWIAPPAPIARERWAIRGHQGTRRRSSPRTGSPGRVTGCPPSHPFLVPIERIAPGIPENDDLIQEGALVR
jgi:hypothetical protein